MKQLKKLLSIAMIISLCLTSIVVVPISVSAVSGQFAVCLNEIVGDTDVAEDYDDFITSSNLRKYLGKSNAAYAFNYAKTSEGIKFFNYGGFDSWIPTEAYYYGAYGFNLGAINDVYGINQGIYEYNVDFRLNLSENDTYSSIDNRRSFVLGFGNGVTTSPSAFNFYNDKITQSEVHAPKDNQIVLYDGKLANGVYHLKYTYTAGISPADSKVTAVLTTPNADKIVLANDEKLRVMPGEKSSSKSWDVATEEDGTTTLGWMTVATRMTWSTSYIEITDASFERVVPTNFNEWFSKLPTFSDKTIVEAQKYPALNENRYAKMYEYSGQPYRRVSAAPNSFKISSVQGWDETGGADRRGYGILKIANVDDIYGENQGIYTYDVDFNLTLTGEEDLAPVSTAGSKKSHCVYLGFFGGAENDGEAASYSVITLYRDKMIEAWERDNNDKVELCSFEGDGLADGKYNIRYDYIAGSSASESSVNIVLTKYNEDGVTLENSPVANVSKKLKHMLGESKEAYSDMASNKLGWLEVGVRTPYSGSGLEILKADFYKIIPVEGITLDRNELILEEGESGQLCATVLPDNATDKSVIWSSSAQDVVTVDQSGKVETVAAGDAVITARAGSFTANCYVTVNEPPAPKFDEWFPQLPMTNMQTLSQIQANTAINDPQFVSLYDYPGQMYRRFSTDSNLFKVSSVQGWDETGGSDRRGYGILKLANVNDIYGKNRGTYTYDVDFNLKLTGEDTNAPLSDAGSKKSHCVYLGFFGGGDDEDASASYSVLNIYRDKITESWERDNGDKADIAVFDNDGISDGKYNIKYKYATSSSATAARVNITITKYKDDGTTLEDLPIVNISDKKLKHMIGETKETYSAMTTNKIGWLEVGVRTPYTGSEIEITKAKFNKDAEKEIYISSPVFYKNEKTKSNRIFSLESGTTYSKIYADLFLEKLNTTPKNKKIMAVLALYGGENKNELLQVDMKKCDFSIENNYACNFELNRFTADDNSVIKLFVWNLNYSPEDSVKTLSIGTDTDLTERDMSLIKSRLISGAYSSTIDVSDITAKLSNGRFSDLTYGKSENCLDALQRVTNMMKAYFSVGNKMYYNETLGSQIKSVLNDWAANDYQSTNWWYNEIGVPNILSGVFVYPVEQLIDNSTKNTLINIAKRGIPTINENTVHKTNDSAGANLTDKLFIAIRIAGLIGDTEGMSTVSKLLENELNVFAPATSQQMNGGNVQSSSLVDYEGIAPDYSFKQHGILYTGGYGKAFVSDINYILECLNDTQFMPSERALNLYAEFIIEGYSPMFKSSGSDFSIMGRNISRDNVDNSVKYNSKAAVEILLNNSQMNRRIDLMNLYEDRLENKDSGTSFAKHYWTSDYTIIQRPDFFVSVKNLSNRNISTEFINGENRYGFRLSDGATAILKSGLEYSGIYPVWDWSLIPGITTTYLSDSDVQIGAKENVKNHMYQTGTKSFVGGVSDGLYAVSVMDYEHKHNHDWYSTTAKKAVFMFDDGFVSLTADIKGTDSSYPVNTTLNQCNLNGDVVYSENNSSTKTLGAETGSNVTAKWINHDGVSYIFPEARSVMVSNKAKTGTWKKINDSGSATTITKNVFEAYISHGKKPNGASLEYTVLPAATIEETKQYVNSPDMLTVTNNSATQSVWSKKASALGAVFYNSNQTIAVGNDVSGLGSTLTVQSSNPCVILLQKTTNGWKLSVSDPTNGGVTSTVITINGVAYTVTLPTGNNKGKTVTLDV